MLTQAAQRSEQALGLIQGHIQECAQNYTELSQKVAPMAEWHAARLKRAQAWARLADKATDKLLDRLVWGLVMVVAVAVGGAKVAPILSRLMEP